MSQHRTTLPCHRPHGFAIQSIQNNVVCLKRYRSKLSAASIHESTTSASPSAPDICIPPIPAAVCIRLTSARRNWINRCLDSPLVDTATNSRVHVYGTVHFAPLGGADGLTELQEVLDAVQPTVLTIEQPYDIGARSGLPYPDVIHQLTGLFPESAPFFAGPGSDNAFRTSYHQLFEAKATATMEALRAAEERLQTLLPGLAQPAKIGRDLLDPYEVFGLYGGCDYVTQTGQLTESLALFGHLPGLEYAALVLTAQQRGVQVCSVDASLRLQEKWVSQLVADFNLTESDLARRLQADLAHLKSFLTPEYQSWDMALAEAVRQREQAAGSSTGVESGGGGKYGRAAGAAPSLSAVTAFKVSRAVAAAMVPYEASREAFGLQAALQPIKFELFKRRARHLLLQVRDLCQRMSVRQVRVDASRFKSAAQLMVTHGSAASVNSEIGLRRQGEVAPGDVELVDVADQPEKVVLAVLGRQYVPYIEELWAKERSVLWHGDVPRTFARSTLEQRGRG